MTIKKQLARSHIAMVLIPVLAAGALLVLGLGLTLVLLDRALLARALLARVTANLLDNSRKYGGRENVRVAISARAAGEQAELAFTDNGPGVPPEQLPRLFDPFYRGDAAHPKLLQTVWGVGYRLGRTAR